MPILPVHKKFTTPGRVLTFVYLVVLKEITGDLSSVNSPSFLNTEAYLGKKLYLGGYTNSWLASGGSRIFERGFLGGVLYIFPLSHCNSITLI